jgi:outer membrane protein assembly factor BamB
MTRITKRSGVRVRTWCVLAAGLASAGAASVAPAADWPQWRGPNRDAISKETGLLKQWPEGGPPLAWTGKGIGQGYSAPAVAGGRIYLMGEDDKSSYVHALDAKNGSILWSTPVGKTGGNYEGPRSTPTVDGERVYALGQWGDLVCLSAKDGKEVWRKNLADDFKGQMGDWQYTESPLVDGKRVVVTPGGPDGAMLALDKSNGKPLWRTKDFTDQAQYSSIVLAKIGGKPTYLQLTQRSLVGVNPENGSLLWRAERPGQTAVIPTPVYADNHVFVTSGYGVGGDLFKITPTGGKFTAARVYHENDLDVHVGGVVLLDGHVYGTTDPGTLTCFDLLTGKTKWADEGPGKGATVYADGHLYVRNEGTPGDVTLVEATPKGYVEKGFLKQPQGSGKNTWPPPVIADGKLYLRDQDVLLCYDVKAK